MNEYTFDMHLVAAITLKAESVEAGQKALADVLNCADTNFGAWPDGDPVTGEVSLRGIPSVGLVNGDITDACEDQSAALATMGQLMHDMADDLFNTGIAADIMHRMHLLADDLQQLSAGEG